eukprot:SAG31_NODE_2609_length_5382_cov_6.846678_3_plen_177_part_00
MLFMLPNLGDALACQGQSLAFVKALDECDRLLRAADPSLQVIEVLVGVDAAAAVAGEPKVFSGRALDVVRWHQLTHLLDTDVRTANAAAFSVQYALYRVVVDEWGVKPNCVLGYSVGELAAAVAAGVLTLEAVCKRFGRLNYENFIPVGETSKLLVVYLPVDRLSRAVSEMVYCRA